MRAPPRITWFLVWVVAGCTGSIDGRGTGEDDRSYDGTGGTSAGGSAGAGAVSPPLPPPAECRAGVGDQVLRRLTAAEYRRSVDALFPGLIWPAVELPSDTAAFGFTTQTSPVNDVALAAYLDAASAIAAEVAKSPALALGGCDLAKAGEATCTSSMIRTIGRRAFRRPLTAAEIGKLQERFTKARTGGTFAGALATVVERLLASPAFLYRVELGTAAPEVGSDVFRLDGYELASRLAFLLWKATPDEQLLEAAARGDLGKPGGLATAARRLLADARAADVLWDFHREWLHLDHLNEIIKDPKVFPQFTDELRGSMLEETRRFVVAAFADGNATLDELLRGRATAIDGNLAKIYGVAGVTGDGFKSVELPAQGGRAGLLGQASFLATHATSSDSSIIHRGVMVRTQVLCLPVPKPSPDIDTDPKVDRLVTQPCASCHEVIDPVGRAFEHFDGLGRYRSETAAGPVNAAGEMKGTSDIDGPLSGADDLLAKLARSTHTASCLAEQWWKFAFARAPGEEDACSLELARNALVEHDGDVVALIEALVESPAFRLVRRNRVTSEVCQ